MHMRNTPALMYHPIRVETSVGGTEHCFEVVWVWQIAVGHLPRNLKINAELTSLSSIVRFSEDDFEPAWHAALQSGYVSSPTRLPCKTLWIRTVESIAYTFVFNRPRHSKDGSWFLERPSADRCQETGMRYGKFKMVSPFSWGRSW